MQIFLFMQIYSLQQSSLCYILVKSKDYCAFSGSGQKSSILVAIYWSSFTVDGRCFNLFTMNNHYLKISWHLKINYS